MALDVDALYVVPSLFFAFCFRFALLCCYLLFALYDKCYLSQCMGLRQWGICDQQSLRSACSSAQSDLGVCLLLEYYVTVGLLTGRRFGFLCHGGGLCRLIWVCACCNVTLLEITCHDSRF